MTIASLTTEDGIDGIDGNSSSGIEEKPDLAPLEKQGISLGHKF